VPNDVGGGVAYIGLLAPQPLRGDLRSWFDATWRVWQGQFRVVDVGATPSARQTVQGLEWLRIYSRVSSPAFGFCAFVLGAVPPYSFLLGGKLVAMLATSSQVRLDFSKKYADRAARISSEPGDGRLAMITTTSALGRSSIYNRLTFDGRTLYNRAGQTAGSGEFHFSNGLYSDISAYAARYCIPTGSTRRGARDLETDVK
jgi:hypothetical protein